MPRASSRGAERPAASRRFSGSRWQAAQRNCSTSFRPSPSFDRRLETIVLRCLFPSRFLLGEKQSERGTLVVRQRRKWACGDRGSDEPVRRARSRRNPPGVCRRCASGRRRRANRWRRGRASHDRPGSPARRTVVPPFWHPVSELFSWVCPWAEDGAMASVSAASAASRRRRPPACRTIRTPASVAANDHPSHVHPPSANEPANRARDCRSGDPAPEPAKTIAPRRGNGHSAARARAIARARSRARQAFSRGWERKRGGIGSRPKSGPDHNNINRASFSVRRKDSSSG